MDENNFLIIEELRKALKELEERLDKKQQTYLKISQLDTKDITNTALKQVQKTVNDAHNELYTRIDPLLRELEQKQEDRELSTNQIVKLQKRVSHIESTLHITHD